MGSRTPTLVAAALAGALLLGSPPATVHAQDGYLFRAPQAQLTLRAGPQLPRAHSDLFDDITSELTLERSDFRAPALGAELSLLLGRRLSLGMGVDWAESHARSEYRDLIGDDGLPIEQNTRLRTVPVMATARWSLVPRGRALSQLAWIPSRTNPYVGAGAGVTWYRLQQDGEFVNRATGDIFLQEYESSDQALTAHAVAGVDHWFTPRLGLTLEGRYTHGSAPVSGSYAGFQSMDLRGVQATLGLSVRW
jgi:opacity protein-like surface antigen